MAQSAPMYWQNSHVVAPARASKSASSHHHERAGIGAVLGLALLMFFAPLVTLHGALVGDESPNGFAIHARLATLLSSIDITSSAFAHGNGGSTGSVSERPMASTPMETPESLKLEWLASDLIFAALAFAALGLVSLFAYPRAVTALALTGGFVGSFAILHLYLLNGGVHLWTNQLIESGLLGSPQDPFVAMRMLMARSFELDPGVGLYVLTACLFLASALSYTSVIPRIHSVVRKSPRVQIAVPIRIRPVDPQFNEETSTTVDVSQHGLYFVSSRPHYYAGMEIRLNRNPHLGELASHEERGSIVRVRALDAGKFGVAVRLISPPVA
jgi:PilZ domain-containing protein